MSLPQSRVLVWALAQDGSWKKRAFVDILLWLVILRLSNRTSYINNNASTSFFAKVIREASCDVKDVLGSLLC